LDAPSCSHLDNEPRDHNLFQAVCRTNRPDGDDKGLRPHRGLQGSVQRGGVSHRLSEGWPGRVRMLAGHEWLRATGRFLAGDIIAAIVGGAGDRVAGQSMTWKRFVRFC
jgi:hypothetical protein